MVGWMMWLPAPAQALWHAQQFAVVSPSACPVSFRDAFSFTGNEALLGNTDRGSIGLCAERKFLLAALSAYSVAGSLPFKSGGIGGRLDYNGSPDYNESEVELAYGMRLGKRAAVGLGFSYRTLSIAGYGHAGTLAADFSFLFEPVSHWFIGLRMANVPAGHLGKQQPEKPASVFQLQLGIEASPAVLLTVSMLKEESLSVSARLGIEYQFERQFFAGLGIETTTASPYGKVGWQWKRIRIVLCASFHTVLGTTPTLFVMTEGKTNSS